MRTTWNNFNISPTTLGNTQKANYNRPTRSPNDTRKLVIVGTRGIGVVVVSPIKQGTLSLDRMRVKA